MEFKDLENKMVGLVSQIQSGTLKVLAVEWRRSVTKNFQSGGRPAWQARSPIYARSKRAKGTKIMKISGALMNVNTDIDIGQSAVKLMMDPRAKAYAKVHNEGGTINMPPRKLKFRKSKSGRTVFAGSKHKKIIKTTTSKAYTVNMPKREFTNIPQEDFPRIVSAIKQQLKLS